MPSPSASIFPTPSPPRSSLPPPPSPIPPIPPIPCRSTPHSCLCSPSDRPPSGGTLPLCRRCLPGPGVFTSPVLRTPALPSSSSCPSSSSSSPTRRASTLFRSGYSLLLGRFSPRRPSGPFGRLPSPVCPFPWAQPPILLVGTKMSAIGRAGLWHACCWRADPCRAGRALEGPSR